MSELAQGMDRYLRDRVDGIRRWPLSEIRQLASYSDEEVRIEGKVCTMAIWKSQSSDGVIDIIVQVYHTGLLYRLFGAGMMAADGFRVDTAGKVLTLPEEIRLRYC